MKNTYTVILEPNGNIYGEFTNKAKALKKARYVFNNIAENGDNVVIYKNEAEENSECVYFKEK